MDKCLGGLILGLLIASLDVSLAQVVQGQDTTATTYTALVPVNIKCTSDPVKGLSCAAKYPDQCRERWNFPNPCTADNMMNNITKFVHPFDRTKFLMCGDLGKLYVVQCPQFEVFHVGCGQCVGENAGQTSSCEVPLAQYTSNPCTQQAIQANKLFFPFPGNMSKFIHCDVWGKAWERICTPGEVWSQWDYACVLPSLINPCKSQASVANQLYTHPCDQSLYVQCDAIGRAYAIACDVGFVFLEERQGCVPQVEYPGNLHGSYCGNYKFSFKAGTVLGNAKTGDTNMVLTARATVADRGVIADTTRPIGSNGINVDIQSLNGVGSGTGSAFKGAGSITLMDFTSGLNNVASQTVVSTDSQSSGSANKAVNTVGAAPNVVGASVNVDATAAGLNALDQSNVNSAGPDLAFGINHGAVVDPISGQTTFLQANSVLAGLQDIAAGNGKRNQDIATGTFQVLQGQGANVRGNDLSSILADWQTSVDIANGMNTNVKLAGSSANTQALHPSQVKGYMFSDIPFSEPCTAENIMEGRLYFKVLNDPHRYIQCDAGGVMYLRICSTHGRDWFDVYSNTCVDGPIHMADKMIRAGK